MNTTTQQFENGTPVSFKGNDYVVISYAKGWFLLENPIGQVKARAKDLKPVSSGKRTMGTTLLKYRAGYVDTVAYSGRKSLNNDDEVAEFLDGMSPEETLAAAERILGMDVGELANRYINLNAGSRRMTGGNLIRFAMKRGDITATDLH